MGTSNVAAAPVATGDGRMSTVELSLLDGFRVRLDGRRVHLPVSLQRVVAFVALSDHPLRRLYVAGNLWLDSTENHANASLRTALWRLGREECDLVDTSGHQLELAAGVSVDLHQARDRARRALRHEPVTADDLDSLCFTGELLPDWYDDWVPIERERFRQLRLHALEALCEKLTGEGRYAAAIEAGHASVAAEPERETAHRVLIAAYLAEGNPGEAIRQYRLFCDLLQRKLGLEPSAKLKRLIAAFL